MKYLLLLILFSYQLTSFSQLLKKDYSLISYSNGLYQSTFTENYPSPDNLSKIQNTYLYTKYNAKLSTEKVLWKHFGAALSFNLSKYPVNNTRYKLLNHKESKISAIPHIINRNKYVISLPITYTLFNKLTLINSNKKSSYSVENAEIGARVTSIIKDKFLFITEIKYSSQNLIISDKNNDDTVYKISISEFPITIGLVYILDKLAE